MCAENLAQKLKNDLRDNNVTYLNFSLFSVYSKTSCYFTKTDIW